MHDAAGLKPYYTLTEFASLIRVSYSTAKRMACEGVINRVSLRTNGRKVVPRAEVERIASKLGLTL